MTKRKFVVCFDGTWNTPDKGARPTNVVKMVRAVRCVDAAGLSQVVFYDKGVGTGGGLDKYTGGIFGHGLTDNVVDGYRFVANNHEPDDEIFIFGFSRGAYTARSLAGLIGLAGLLSPLDLGGGLDKVMEIYRDKDLDVAQKKAAIAKQPLSNRREVPIRCVGVWDTVGSLGVPFDSARRLFLNRRYGFHDVQLGGAVDFAFHAVAIDEKRASFSPTLWVSPDGRPKRDGQVVEQVWFPGAHFNVGGSYPDEGLADIAFDWMARRVSEEAKLALDWAPATTDNAAAKGVDSRGAMYAGSKLYPYQRVINRVIPKGEGFGEWFRRTVPAFDRRNIPPDGLVTVNEMLHVSALDRWGLQGVPHDCKPEGACAPQPYRPVNLAAALAGGARMPVVGWDGKPMAAPPWP
jgi:uncharacterized protein (DUF2235 family)